MAWLQAQLRELVAFPDLQPLSDSVVAAIQEFQRYLGTPRVAGLRCTHLQWAGWPPLQPGPSR